MCVVVVGHSTGVVSNLIKMWILEAGCPHNPHFLSIGVRYVAKQSKLGCVLSCLCSQPTQVRGEKKQNSLSSLVTDDSRSTNHTCVECVQTVYILYQLRRTSWYSTIHDVQYPVV